MTLQGAPRGWPATLRAGRVGLRPITRHDRAGWLEVRSRNAAWLAPWEATPPRDGGRVLTFAQMVRSLRAQARQGTMLPFVVTYDDRLVGQVTVGGITWGSLASAYVGYWVDARVEGGGSSRPPSPWYDHCFVAGGLHRLEVNIRPENAASPGRGEARLPRGVYPRRRTCTSPVRGATTARSPSPPARSPRGCSPAGGRPSSRTTADPSLGRRGSRPLICPGIESQSSHQSQD